MVLVEDWLSGELRLAVDDEPDVEACAADVGRQHVGEAQAATDATRPDYPTSRTARQQKGRLARRFLGRGNTAVREHDHHPCA